MSQTENRLPDNQNVGLSVSMGTLSLVMTVLAFSAPLSTATGFIPQLLIFGDLPGVGNQAPWIYVLCMVTLGCFAVGFAKMGTVMERPGGFYAYIVDALGKKVGLGAAFTSAIGYSLVGFFMLGLMAIVVDGLVTSVGGPNIPWPVYALFFALLSTLLASLSIDFSAKFLFVVMCCEAAIMIIFDIVCFVHGSPAGTTGGSWSFINLSTGTVGIAMLVHGGTQVIELLHYENPANEGKPAPRPNEMGGAHICFFCEEIEEVVAALRKRDDVTVMGDVEKEVGGAIDSTDWVYTVTTWGLVIELMRWTPGKLPYEKDTDVRLVSPPWMRE